MTEAITIDIRTRVLPPSEEVHILFPGEGYSHFGMMRDRRVAFLDFPGFTIGRDEALLGYEDLRERLLRSDALLEWQNGEPRPTDNLDDYRNARNTERRRAWVGSVEKFYSLPEGSLILVPGPTAFGAVLVGEIRGEASQLTILGYGEDTVPARRVEWVAELPKRRFSDDIITRLATPNPFVVLDRTLRAEVVRLSYPNYVYGGEFVARFSTTEKTFDSLDDFNIQAFVNYVAGCLAILETGAHDGTPIDLDRALEALKQRPEGIPELTANINSPGALRYITQDVNSLVIAAFMSLALAGTPAQAGTVHIVNSAAGPKDVCAYMVEERIRQAFEIMDIPSLQQACKRVQEASQKTGVKPAVKLRHAGGRHRTSDN